MSQNISPKVRMMQSKKIRKTGAMLNIYSYINYYGYDCA